jgi:hypothetical protein
MTSQLVALATQSRKALGFDELELDALDEELAVPHMPISVSRQLALPLELVEEVDVPKQVPHLAMMLLTAFSQRDGVLDGQPVSPKAASIRQSKARFMGSSTKK